jgi:hypothetical protein
MAGLKGKRNKATKARMDELRASGMVIGVSGHTLQPGTPEYEKALKSLVEATSPDELMPRKIPK